MKSVRPPVPLLTFLLHPSRTSMVGLEKTAAKGLEHSPCHVTSFGRTSRRLSSALALSSVYWDYVALNINGSPRQCNVQLYYFTRRVVFGGAKMRRAVVRFSSHREVRVWYWRMEDKTLVVGDKVKPLKRTTTGDDRGKRWYWQFYYPRSAAHRIPEWCVFIKIGICSCSQLNKWQRAKESRLLSSYPSRLACPKQTWP